MSNNIKEMTDNELKLLARQEIIKIQICLNNLEMISQEMYSRTGKEEPNQGDNG